MRTFYAAGLIITISASPGCVGVALTTPTEVEIRNPSAYQAGWWLSKQHRWSCELPAPLTKSEFVANWGQPESKSGSDGTEAWIYSETHRLCGAWVWVIVPVPLLMPVCRTHDRVEFKGDTAVLARSRRLDVVGAGISLFPAPLPGPFWFRHATPAENEPGGLPKRVCGHPPTIYWK